MGAWFGPIAAVFIGGLATVVVTVTWMKLFPALRDIDRPEDSLAK
jgi:hypothetical protein